MLSTTGVGTAVGTAEGFAVGEVAFTEMAYSSEEQTASWAVMSSME